MRTDVLIVGAGPTGLVTANVLAREGVSFRVVDKKAGPNEESRALAVVARTLELFDKLGLADRAIEEGVAGTAIDLLAEGRPAASFSLADAGWDASPYPFYLALEQSKTERLLIAALEEAGSRVEWQTELAALTQHGGGTRAVVRRPGGDEEEIETRFVVGADGAHSPMRRTLGVPFEGDTYEHGFFLADVTMDWPMSRRGQYVNLTRGGFQGFVPLSGEGRFRITGTLSPEHTAGGSLDLEDVRAMVREGGVDARIHGANWVTAYRLHRRMAGRFRVGGAFLIGDAAHVHSPAGAQGMNTGIGDAYNLAWKLALVAKGQARPALLDSYEAERMPVVRRVLGGTDRAFDLENSDNAFVKRRDPYRSTAATSAASSLSERCLGGGTTRGTSFTALEGSRGISPSSVAHPKYLFIEIRCRLIDAGFISSVFFRCERYSVIVGVVTSAGENGSPASSPSAHVASQKAANCLKSER